MDMISSTNAAQKPSQPAPIIKSSISSVAPAQKTVPKTNMIANLDDLEDLA